MEELEEWNIGMEEWKNGTLGHSIIPPFIIPFVYSQRANFTTLPSCAAW
jgi:hypothetical protein